jgi:hypothetical protein
VPEADLADDDTADDDTADDDAADDGLAGEGDRETEAALERLVGELGPDPRAWAASGDGAVLAQSRWEAVEPGAAAGDGPASGDFLVRIGGAYVIYQTDGADWEWDDLDAADDATAIARFRDHQGD